MNNITIRMSKTKLSNEILPRVGVGGLIFDKRKGVLLLLRNRPPEVGHWSIPGGKVEFQEPIEDALKREVKEELEIEIKVVSLLGVTDHMIPKENIHWVSPCYLVKIVSGRIKNLEPKKSSRIKWFSLNNLPKNIAIPARRAIHSYTSLTLHPKKYPPVN